VRKDGTFTGRLSRSRSESPVSLTWQSIQFTGGNYKLWDQFTRRNGRRASRITPEMEQRRRSEARTVDAVNPGQEQNERDHHQQGKRGVWRLWRSFYRDAAERRVFVDLATLPESAEPGFEYWGEDRGPV